MADRSSTYTLEFAGNIAAGANEGTSALERLQKQMVALKNVGATATAPLVNAIKSVKPAADAAGQSVATAGKAASSSGFEFANLSKAMGSVGVAGGGVVDKGTQLYGVFAKLIASPIGVAAAIVVLTAALVAGAVAFAHWALVGADAARSIGLLAKAATGSDAGAIALANDVRRLSNMTGLGTDALRSMGLELARAGFQGGQLSQVFDLVAIASSAMGDTAAGKLREIAETAMRTKRFATNALQLKGTGVGLDDVAAALAVKFKISLGQAKASLVSGAVNVQAGLDALDTAVKKKLGGIAQAQAIGFGVQLDRLAANLGGLFAGLDIDPFLKGLADMLSIFDQSTVSGQGLATAMKGIAGPLLEGLTALMPVGKAFFQGMIIACLELAIVVLKARRWLIETFGKGKSSADDMTTAITAGKAAFWTVAIVVGILAAALALAAVGAALMWVALFAPIAIVGYGLYKLYGILTGVFDSVKTYLQSLDFGAIASGLIDGLVGGIKSGASWVIDAVKGLGKSAIGALKSVLTIGSPSKVFQDLGMFTAKGFAIGVDEGSPGVERSVASMVQTPDDVRGSTNNRVTRTIGQVVVNIHGVKDAAQLQGTGFFQKLVGELEGALVTGGDLSPEPEGA